MWAHQRMCSSVGIRWMALRLGWSFQEKWVWASTRPGIRVAPAPSTTVTPPTGIDRVPWATREIRLPCTRTSPAKAAVPLPSRTRTFMNRTLTGSPPSPGTGVPQETTVPGEASSRRAALEAHGNKLLRSLSSQGEGTSGEEPLPRVGVLDPDGADGAVLRRLQDLRLRIPGRVGHLGLAVGVVDEHPGGDGQARAVPDARAMVHPHAEAPPHHRQLTGSDLRVRIWMLGWYSSRSASRWNAGNRSASARNTSWPSSRARVTPRQKWMPAPNATWGFGLRPTSKRSGSGNAAGSRFADAIAQRSRSSLRITFPPSGTSSVAMRWVDFTGGS